MAALCRDAATSMAMNLSELLATVRRVEVRTNRLVNDTRISEARRVLTPLAQRGNKKA